MTSLMGWAPNWPATLGTTSLPKLLESPRTLLYPFLEMRFLVASATTSAVLSK